MVGCAMRTKMPTGRYLHGAHGAPYCDNTLNLLVLSLSPIIHPFNLTKHCSNKSIIYRYNSVLVV